MNDTLTEQHITVFHVHVPVRDSTGAFVVQWIHCPLHNREVASLSPAETIGGGALRQDIHIQIASYFSLMTMDIIRNKRIRLKLKEYVL